MYVHRSRIMVYLFATFVVVVLVYAYFEARNMLYGPQVVLTTPETITVPDELIAISGTSKNVVSITLDGRSVFVDDNGSFTEKLLLAEGVNRFVFEARDKFGRETQRTLEVVYQPPTPAERTPEKTDTIETPPTYES